MIMIEKKYFSILKTIIYISGMTKTSYIIDVPAHILRGISVAITQSLYAMLLTLAFIIHNRPLVLTSYLFQ